MLVLEEREEPLIAEAHARVSIERETGTCQDFVLLHSAFIITALDDATSSLPFLLEAEWKVPRGKS